MSRADPSPSLPSAARKAQVDCSTVNAERWADVTGFEGFYRVSDSGRVASLDRGKCMGGRMRRGRELRPFGRQPVVTLVAHGERKRFLVSRLVAQHFIQQLAVGDNVFHIDLDAANNDVSNLVVTTMKEVVRMTRAALFCFERCERVELTQEKANEYLHYQDGRLFRKKSTGPGVEVGSDAAYYLSGVGRVSFLGNHYVLSRLIYLMHYGYFPDYVIPIDGDAGNSRIENLRGVTASEWAVISERITNIGQHEAKP